jgi:hypothetical protein
MQISIMEALGMECTHYYEIGKIIYAIASIKVPAYDEIKYFFSWISSAPHTTKFFTIIVVDLPPTYGVVLGQYWSFTIGGYIIIHGSCMILPNKDGTLVKFPQE